MTQVMLAVPAAAASASRIYPNGKQAVSPSPPAAKTFRTNRVPSAPVAPETAECARVWLMRRQGG